MHLLQLKMEHKRYVCCGKIDKKLLWLGLIDAIYWTKIYSSSPSVSEYVLVGMLVYMCLRVSGSDGSYSGSDWHEPGPVSGQDWDSDKCRESLDHNTTQPCWWWHLPAYGNSNFLVVPLASLCCRPHIYVPTSIPLILIELSSLCFYLPCL